MVLAILDWKEQGKEGGSTRGGSLDGPLAEAPIFGWGILPTVVTLLSPKERPQGNKQSPPLLGASLVAQLVKNPPAIWEAWV